MQFVVGEYDHMNESDPLTLPVDLDELCRRIVSMNRGTERLLSALIRQLKASKRQKFHSELGAAIEEAVVVFYRKN